MQLFFNMLLAIFYKLIKRKNPRDLAAPEKVYAQAVSTSKATLKDVAAEVAQNTTINAEELEAAYKMGNKVIARRLAEGQTVDIEYLAMFYPSLKSAGADTEEAFNANTHVKKQGVTIRPKAYLLKVVQEAMLKRK